MKDGRENCLDHEILDGPVRRRRSNPFAVARPSLTITGFAIFRLADGSDDGVPGNLDVVECALGDYFEFFPRG